MKGLLINTIFILLFTTSISFSQDNFSVFSDKLNVLEKHCSVMVFESESADSDSKKRNFSNPFLKKNIRSIFYQVNLEYTILEKDCSLDIVVVWYNPKGEQIYQEVRKEDIRKPGFGINTYHGFTGGCDSKYSNNWEEEGNYYVVFYRGIENPVKFAERSFRISSVEFDENDINNDIAKKMYNALNHLYTFNKFLNTKDGLSDNVYKVLSVYNIAQHIYLNIYERVFIKNVITNMKSIISMVEDKSSIDTYVKNIDNSLISEGNYVDSDLNLLVGQFYLLIDNFNNNIPEITSADVEELKRNVFIAEDCVYKIKL